jgi:hypothetical protein
MWMTRIRILNERPQTALVCLDGFVVVVAGQQLLADCLVDSRLTGRSMHGVLPSLRLPYRNDSSEI